MRNCLMQLVIFCVLVGRQAHPIPPPCTEEELLSSSTVAVEGYVAQVTCGRPYDSGDCLPEEPSPDFRPELVEDCIAQVAVTAVLKGSPGDEVQVPFLKSIRDCENGIPMIPGKPKWDLRLNSKIRYYDSPSCSYSNIWDLMEPFLRGDVTEDGTADIADAISILLVLFASVEGPANPEAMDVDANGTTDLGDAIYLLNFLFRGGAAPSAPFSEAELFTGITVLFDNYLEGPGLESEWGFSCLIDTGTERLLLDAGATGSRLLGNMEALDVTPESFDKIVFSHIHDDHIGGRSALYPLVHGVTVYVPASFPSSFFTEISDRGFPTVVVSGPQEICPGILSSGELGSSPKEQSFYLSTPRGVTLITTCAHPGIVLLVNEARKMGEVYMVLGGFHLFQKTEAEIRNVVGVFRDLGVKMVAPCHCSGDLTRQLFREEYGGDFIDVGGGSEIKL